MKRRIVDHVELDEIRSRITVYDFANGVEVNRRPAFPASRTRQSFRELVRAGAEAAEKFRQFMEAAHG